MSKFREAARKLRERRAQRVVECSIVLATYNKPKLLERTLDSILRQRPPFRYEVIVVDDGSTDNTAAIRADAARSKSILERIPEGRWGDPADIGGAAVFLASSAADYVQGHILAVDGGWLAR